MFFDWNDYHELSERSPESRKSRCINADSWSYDIAQPTHCTMVLQLLRCKTFETWNSFWGIDLPTQACNWSTKNEANLWTSCVKQKAIFKMILLAPVIIFLKWQIFYKGKVLIIHSIDSTKLVLNKAPLLTGSFHCKLGLTKNFDETT